MELLLAIFIFLTVVFMVWGFSLLWGKEEKRVEKRLGYYTQRDKENQLPVQTQKEEDSLLTGVKAQLDKRSWIQELELELQKADIPMKGSEMALLFFISITLGGIVGWLFFGLVGGLILALSGYLIPSLFIRIKQKRRLKHFNQQINDCLALISNSLKAGFSFFQALDLVAKEMEGPIAQEFGRVIKEINLGASPEEALKEMVERVNSQDMDLVVQAVLIQRQVGGNLAEILDKIAVTIRERIRIQGEIKTLTAQGRMSGFVIALLPVVLGFILSMLNPDYFRSLWTTVIGRIFIGFALILELIGVMIIRKIVNIRI